MSDKQNAKRREAVPVAELPAVQEQVRRGQQRQALKKAGRLFRVKHPAFGSREVQAKDALDAVRQFAVERCGAQAENEEWLKSFAKECRVAKLAPALVAA
jgi:hypothetical protein